MDVVSYINWLNTQKSKLWTSNHPKSCPHHTKLIITQSSCIPTRCLVGGWATPLKNIEVSGDYYSQYMGKVKTCSKPPTRYTLTVPNSQRHIWLYNVPNHQRNNVGNTPLYLSLYTQHYVYIFIYMYIYLYIYILNHCIHIYIYKSLYHYMYIYI